MVSLSHVALHSSLVVIGAGLLFYFPTPAAASLISATSNAYGESVSITAQPLIGDLATITSGPLPVSMGIAPGVYNNTLSALSAVVTGVLSTGVLNTAASSSVDGTVGSKTTSGSATVNNLLVGLLGAVGLNAGAVASSASIAGDFGSLTPLGGTVLTGLSLNGLQVDVDPVPNAILLNLAGVTIIANEQIITGTANALDLTVNALDIIFSNAPEFLGGVLNSVNGRIVIGHSEAVMTAVADSTVPEPATTPLLAASLISLVGMRRWFSRKQMQAC